MSSVPRTIGSRSRFVMTYQYGVIAFLAAKLATDDNIDDYVIYTNEASAGKFDDVIVRVRFKDPEVLHVYLLQIKYKENKKLNISDVDNGSPNITDYINSFDQIMADPSASCRQGIPNENVRFGIVTNTSLLLPVKLRDRNMFHLNLGMYSEGGGTDKTLLPLKGEAWRFICQDSESSRYQSFCQGVHLYLNQPKLEDIKKDLQVICEVNANDIINFMENYFNDYFLCKQGLNKEQFEIELLKMRYNDSIIPPSQPTGFVNDELVDIWNNITSNQDITIVNNDEDVPAESCLFNCWTQNVISLLNLKVTRKDLIAGEFLDEGVITKFKIYSSTKKRRYWIKIPLKLSSLFIELWKYGDLPFILKIKFQLRDFKKYMHLRRKYVIVEDFNKTIEDTDERNLQIKLFRHIGNVDNLELRNKLLENVRVSLQERKPTTLKSIVGDNMEVMKTLTCANIIKLMQKRTPYLKEYYLNGADYLAFFIEDDTVSHDDVGFKEPREIGVNINIICKSKEIRSIINQFVRNRRYKGYTVYYLGQNKLELIREKKIILRNCCQDQYGSPLYYSDQDQFIPVIGVPILHETHDYIDRYLTKATVPKSYFEFQEKQICLVLNAHRTNDAEIRYENIDINATKLVLPEGKSSFIKVDKDNRQKYWDKLSNLEYPLLEVTIENDEMTILRYMRCYNLANYIAFDGGILTQEEYFKEIATGDNQITVLIGEPGIGKTSLLKSLCNYFDERNYILFYDMKDCQKHLRQNKDFLIKPVKYIFDYFHRKSPQQFFHHFYTTKKLVLFLDSFDEIASDCEKEALQLIKVIANSGIQIVIASGLYGCNILMREFNVPFVKLKPLNRLFSKYEPQQSIKQSNNLNKFPTEFKENPLYLKFLTLICENSVQPANLTKYQLYEKCLRIKIGNYLASNDAIVSQRNLQDGVAILQRIALKVICGKEKIEEVFKLNQDGKENGDTKYGIITSFDADGYPKFYHSTFVEFLVASWVVNAKDNPLFQNFVKELYQQLWHGRKIYVLNILSERLKPHQAVLQSNITKVEKLHDDDRNCWNIADDLGRTALHLATIQCKYSPSQYISYKILDTVVQSMRNHGYKMNKRDSIAKWNWSDYIDADMFQSLLIYRCVETLKAYLDYTKEYDRKRMFPLLNFSVAYRAAVRLLSIEIIRNLLFLQNRGNKKFDLFYRVCSPSTEDEFPSLEENFEIEGNLTLLHIACIYGNICLVRHLVEREGYNGNVTDNIGCTPLHYGIILNTSNCNGDERNGNMAIVKVLLQNARNRNRDELTHLDINAQNLDGNTTLHLAVEMENEELTKLLLENGADSNILNNKGDSPFDIATSKKNLNILHMLWPKFDFSDDIINYETIGLTQKEKNQTPVQRAICNQYTDKIIAKLLLQQLTAINATDNNGKTALHYAAVYGYAKIVILLLKLGADVNAEDKLEQTSLHYTVAANEFFVFGLLLKHGANVNTLTVYGESPLHRALLDVNIDLVKALLEYGADPNVLMVAPSNIINTLFDEIEPTSSIPRRSSYIRKSAKKNTKDDFINRSKIYRPDTPHATAVENLMSAEIVYNVKKEMEVLGISRSKSSKISTKFGWSNDPRYSLRVWEKNYMEMPLHYCMRKKYIDLIKLLIAKGAKINIRDDNRKTRFHLSVEENNFVLRKLLLNAWELKQPTSFLKQEHEAIDFDKVSVEDNVRLVNLLIENELNVKFQDKHKRTFLHYAVQFRNVFLTKLFLALGADINSQDEKGNTPLHYAVRTKYVGPVYLFVDIDKYFKTAYYYMRGNNNKTIVTLLLENGANVDIQDKYHNTPIQYVNQNKYTGILCVLQLDEIADFSDSILKTDPFWNIENQSVGTVKLFKSYPASFALVPLQINKYANTSEIRDKVHELAEKYYKTTTNVNYEIIELLLKHNADVNIKNNDGRVALHYAAIHQSVQLIKELLSEKEINVNIQDINKKTPLHYAAETLNVNTSRLLIEKGADVNLQDDKLATPLHYAVMKKKVFPEIDWIIDFQTYVSPSVDFVTGQFLEAYSKTIDKDTRLCTTL